MPKPVRVVPPLEKDIEAKFVKLLRLEGLQQIKLNLLGRRSWPDRLIIGPKGRVCFVELKRPLIGRLSQGQKVVIEDLKNLGHSVLVSSDALEAFTWVKNELQKVEN